MLAQITKTIVADNLLGIIGRLFAGLSLFALLERSLRFGVGAVFATITSYMDKVLAILVGSWGDPLAKALLASVGALGLSVTVHPDWRYYFSLFAIYILRNSIRLVVNPRCRGAGVTLFVGGMSSAFIHSVLLAAVPLNGSVQSAALIVFLPISLFLSYEAIRVLWFATFLRQYEAEARGWPVLTWRKEIARLAPHSLNQAAWAAGWASVLVILLISVGYSHLKVAVVFFLLVLMIIDWTHRGLGLAKFGAARRGQDWKDQILREPSIQVALAMIGVLFWCGVFVLTNAGLSLYGL